MTSPDIQRIAVPIGGTPTPRTCPTCAATTPTIPLLCSDPWHQPVRLCCGQKHAGPQCPDGLVMCCICFNRFPVEGLSVDPDDGKPWDVCIGCDAAEKEAIRVRTQ